MKGRCIACLLLIFLAACNAPSAITTSSVTSGTTPGLPQPSAIPEAASSSETAPDRAQPSEISDATTFPITATAQLSTTCPIQASGDFIEDFRISKDELAKFDDRGMVIPDEEEFNTWKKLVQQVTAGKLSLACDTLRTARFPYQLYQFYDEASKKIYFILRETLPPQTGWGVFIFNPSTKLDLVVEIPHPSTDMYTEEQGLDMFEKTGAQALLIAGTRRCASGANVPGVTPKCKDATGYGDSDVAHLQRSAFLAAHEALLPCNGSNVAIQLHGNENDACPDVFISNTLSIPGPLTKLFAEEIKKSCSQTTLDMASSTSSCPLVANDNVEGKYLRACPTAEGAPPERFLHIEQSLKFRKNSGCLEDAVIATFADRGHITFFPTIYH